MSGDYASEENLREKEGYAQFDIDIFAVGRLSVREFFT